MAVTRNDVARAAGVSAATVSYVLNDGPRPVSDATRAKVLQAVAQLGYQPNSLARNLRLQRTSTLGLLVPDIHNPYFAEVARGVEDFAFSRGYRVFLCHSSYNLQRELEYIDVLRAERAAGLIWFPATPELEPARRLIDCGMPVVVLDRHLSLPELAYITADNYAGGYQASQHLIALGHRRIGCIVRPVPLIHAQDRTRGHLQALADHGLSGDPELLVPGGFRLEQGLAAADHLLSLKPRPTAIFAYNDMMALAALRSAQARGLRVPQDVSVVGFDDIPQAAYACPALTTVAQPKFDMGRIGAERLLALMAGTNGPRGDPIVLEVRLVVRESSGPAPQAAA